MGVRSCGIRPSDAAGRCSAMPEPLTRKSGKLRRYADLARTPARLAIAPMPQFEARRGRSRPRSAGKPHEDTKLGFRVSTRGTVIDLRQHAIAGCCAVHYSWRFDRDDRT